jgi:type IV fimbrial biogenesis protein FimT
MSRPARHLPSLVSGRSRHSGFSLIELVVVIGMLLLIILVGLPAFTGILASMRVRAVAESLLSGVQTARTEAVRRNQPASFNLDAEQGGGWSILLVADGSTLQTKPASEGGSVNVQGDMGSSLTFNNLGQRTAPAGGVLTFSLTNPSVGDCQPTGNIRCLSVTVEPGGQSRLCDPQRTAPDPQAC